MARIFKDRVITAIDVGTTKICVLIAQQLTEDEIEIIGIGRAPSDGLSKGVVVNVAKTIKSIKSAVEEAELAAGITVESAYVGISGGHIQSLNSHGVVPIKKGYVRPSDIEAVLDAAKAIPIAEGYQILHVLPQYFIIDGQDRLIDPVDMYGIRLEVQAHIILGAVASVQNLVKCCESAGIKVNDIILEQLASADAVLSEDEKDLGIAVLDIGGGTSDLALYRYGSIRHTMVLPVAGNHFTNDIAVGLRTTHKDAEDIKKEYGCAWHPIMQQDPQMITIHDAHGSAEQQVSLERLHRIVEARGRELLELVKHDITQKQLEPFMQAGLVITGGGSLLNGMQELAYSIFKKPVRIGTPTSSYALPEALSTPLYATSYGLLVYASNHHKNSATRSLSGPLYQKIVARMRSWVSDFF